MTLSYSCYEIGHTWTPFCGHAIKDIAKVSLKESLKIYTSLYVLAAILKKRGKKYYLKKLIPEILQSTIFLATNAFSFVAFFCFWRYVCRKFYFLSTAYLPAASAAFVSINLERKSRRGLLALYVANLGIESLYRMAVARNFLQPLKYGEVFMFSIVSAVFLYLYRTNGGLSSSVASGIRFFVGSEEHADSSRDNDSAEERDQSSPKRHGTNKYLSIISHLQQNIQQSSKHQLCKHSFGCVHYIMQGFFHMFGIGYSLQMAIKLLPSLFHNILQPKDMLKFVVHTDNFSFGAFLAFFCAVFRSINCALRWIRKKDSGFNGLIAGFVAGWSMLWYKSTTLALYLTSKLAEVLYFKGIEKKIFPHIPSADVVIYILSTALLFHAAMFEPQSLRPAYWKFLLRITGNKFETINRQLLDIFQTKASLLDPEFWPNYNSAFSDLV